MGNRKNYRAPFIESERFHVYNRTNNRELLFKEDRNRIHFLHLYKQYMSPLLDTHAWTLMPNHFHFQVQVKSFDDIRYNLKMLRLEDLTATDNRFIAGQVVVENLVSNRFSRFFQSYAQGINSLYDRKGNLFNKTPKRVRIEDDDQFMNVLIYIHANALKHGITRDFTTFPWSSWQGLIGDTNINFVDRAEVMRIFGGKDEFISAHLRRILEYFPEINGLEEDGVPALKGWNPFA